MARTCSTHARSCHCSLHIQAFAHNSVRHCMHLLAISSYHFNHHLTKRLHRIELKVRDGKGEEPRYAGIGTGNMTGTNYLLTILCSKSPCWSVSQSVRLSLCYYVSQSVRLSLCQSVCQSVSLPVWCISRQQCSVPVWCTRQRTAHTPSLSCWR